MTVATIVVVAEQPPLVEVRGADRHDLVAVDEPARAVHGHQPVGVPVERQAEVGAMFDDRRRQRRGWVAPQRSLMLRPSGWSLIAITSAPGRGNSAGATL